MLPLCGNIVDNKSSCKVERIEFVMRGDCDCDRVIETFGV